jgi:Mn-dependent DtxR family transcriptional regulator
MNTLETTVSMLQTMSENDLMEVQNYIRYILYKNEETEIFKTYSEDELVEQLTKSIEQSNKGYTKPASEVSRKMRERYAV